MGKKSMSDKPFGEALSEALAERGMSQRALAELVGVEQSHLSRLARGVDSQKRPSLDLSRKITAALGLPADYFREVREAAVIERLRTDSHLLNRLYRGLGP
jgi:transcriptional regulator with XRE-family HTH domain